MEFGVRRERNGYMSRVGEGYIIDSKTYEYILFV